MAIIAIYSRPTPNVCGAVVLGQYIAVANTRNKVAHGCVRYAAP